ncbi:hypothetical protein K432DRAFT_453673, partial [Lepidopterella palustris CBS 459.81]
RNKRPAIEPFERILYNLYKQTPSYNRDRYISHFYCNATIFNIVFTYRKKSNTTAIYY